MKNIYFVSIGSNNDLLEIAYENLTNANMANVSKINATEAIRKFNVYSKNDYFILSKFEGKLFDHLKNLKMTTFGPQLLLNCLNNDEALPKSSIPLYSNILKDFNVSFTKVDPETRESLTDKINMMGGCVSGDLTDSVDVLVCGAIGSQKYRVAGSRNLYLFKTDWIDCLWEESSKQEYIDPISTIYKTKFSLKTFEGLKLAVTGLSVEDRKTISNLVVENGGEFCTELQVGKCSHLVARETVGKKYCYAKKWKIIIVKPEWVFDSIETGYALEEIKYEVSDKDSGINRGLTSTPRGSMSSLNSFTSAVTVDKIDDTLLTSFDNTNSAISSEVEKFFENCTVSLWRLDKEDREKFRISLEKHGSIVCMSNQDEVGETVTHTIVASESTAVTDDTVPHVTMKWIEDCIEQKKMLPTDGYLVAPIPVTHQDTSHKSDNKEHTIDTQDWNEIDEYFDAESTKIHETQQHATKMEDETMTNMPKNFLSNIIICLLNATKELRVKLDEYSVKLVENEDEADLIVVNDVVLLKSSLNSTPVKYVSQQYMEQCLKAEELYDVSASLFYKPFIKDETNECLLAGCVLAFSGIPELIRNHIKSICQSAGATIQKQMCRRAIPSRKLSATTHLIVDIGKNGSNNQVDYKKIQSAHDWSIPAVSIDWLNQIFQTNKIVDTETYQVKPDHLDQSRISRHCLDETYSSIRPSRMSIKLASKVPKFNDAVNNEKKEARKPEFDLSLGTLVNDDTGFDSDGETLNKSTKFKLDIDNLKDVLKTPEHSNKTMDDYTNVITTPLLEYTNQYLKKHVDEITKKQPGEHDTSWMEMSFTKSPNLQCQLDLILESLVIYISMTTGQRQMELNSIVKQLGGDTSWIYDKDTVTHLVFDEVNITSRDRLEMEQANQDGKFLVSLDWILECNKLKCRVDETKYLIQISSNNQENDNVDMETDISEESKHVSKKRKASNGDENNKRLKLSPVYMEKKPVQSTSEVLLQKQKDCAKNDKSNTAESSSNFDVGEDWFNSASANNFNKATNKSDEMNKENKKLSNSSDKISQTSDNIQEKKYPNLSDEKDNEKSNLSSTLSPLPLSQVASKYQLIMTNIDKDQRAVYEKELSKLGVRVFKADSFCHRTITHLICPYPTRNEKFMAAVASGKWVLHVSFIDFIIREHKWPSELDYELHNSKSTNQKFELNPSERKLAKLASQWRELGGGAYADWQNAVVWVTDNERADRLSKVIEAGGGSVIPWRWLIEDDSEIEAEQDRKRYCIVKEQIKTGVIKISQVFINCRSNPSSIGDLLPPDYTITSLQLQQLTTILSESTWYKLEFIHIALSLPSTQEIAKYDVSKRMQKVLTSPVDNSNIRSSIKRRNTRNSQK